MRYLSNQDITRVLNEMAIYYEMEDVQFKPRAYEKVAMAIAALDREVADLYKEGGIKGLHAIDKLISFHEEKKALISFAVTDRKTSRYLLFNEQNRLCGWRNTKTAEEKISNQIG